MRDESRLASVAGVYREWRLVGPLAGQLACTWMNALPASATSPLQIVPDGCIDIIWTGESLGVAGPDTQPIFESIAAGTVIVGVRFQPGAAPPWLGVPASEIVNGHVRNPMPLVVRASDVLAAKMLGQRRGQFDLKRQRRLE